MSYLRPLVLFGRLFVICAAVFCSPLTAAAIGDTSQAGPSPSYWVVSTRHIASTGVQPGISREVKVLKADPKGCLEQASSEELQRAIADCGRVAIYIPGNRSDLQSGHREGWILFQGLAREAGDRAFVLILWSWPADRITFGERSDIWIKACRADAEAFILAEWIQNLPPNTSTTIVTYSLSARAAAGALHLLGCGEVAERRLPTCAGDRPLRVRVLLVGAAIDAHSLGPGGAFEKAVGQAEIFAITVHQRDTLLRLYPLLYGLRGPQALGFVGPTSLPPDAADKVAIIPVHAWTGAGHAWQTYFSALPVQACLVDIVFHMQ